MSAQHPFVVPSHAGNVNGVLNAGSGDPTCNGMRHVTVGPVPSPGETAPPPGAPDAAFGNAAYKVDFKAVFARLKSVGFNGPTMIEGVEVGATAEETTANARANREFLEKMLASI